MDRQRKKLNGFTLIELIVVMAIFSVILFGAMQLIDPVQKLFIRTSNYESTATAVNNMKTFLEGNIGPVEFLHVYEGGLYDPTTGAVISEKTAVERFMQDYHSNRVVHDTTKTGAEALLSSSCVYPDVEINVIQIDNRKQTIGTQEVKGCISKRVYTMNTKGTPVTGESYYSFNVPATPTESYDFAINQTFYDSYNYDIILGANGVPASYEKFAMTVTGYSKNLKSKYDGVKSASTLVTIGLSNICTNYGQKDAASVVERDASGNVVQVDDGSGNLVDKYRDNVLAFGYYTGMNPTTNAVSKMEYNIETFRKFDAPAALAGSLFFYSLDDDPEGDGTTLNPTAVRSVPAEIYLIFSYPLV